MSALDDPRRLAVIEELRLLSGHADLVLDGATRLASRAVGVPIALVSIVTDDRQVFASQVGMPEGWTEQTPLSHSFCQYVVLDDAPLRVVDAREDGRLAGNDAIDDLGVIAYHGVPLRAPTGETIGSFCVIDGAPREWTPEDREVLQDVARFVEHVLRARQASEALLGVGEERENLVATLVHDIRQPLSSARMAGELLQERMEQLDTATRTEVVGSLTRAVQRVDDLVGQLTDARRPPVRTVDVHRIAEDLRMHAEATSKGKVVVDVPEGLGVRGVPTDVERILANLVRNALVHGGPHVTVTIGARDVDGGVAIDVADDGVGIPAAEQEAIFAFRQQGSRAGSGSGLGLHIVRRLARQAGGDVTVRSAPGRGATFHVDLPHVDHDPARAADGSGSTEGVA